MSFFRQPKPRPFRYHMLYVDERRERLKDIEERAKRELNGDVETQSSVSSRLHGAFGSSRRGKRSAATGFNLLMNTLLLLLIVLVLFVCWNLLVS